MAENKFMSNAALNQIAAEVKAGDQAVEAKIGTLTDLTTTAKGSAVLAINELDAAIKAVDYSDKADKVESAVDGNFAGLDADGNLTDSGKKPADFALVDDLGTAAEADIATVAIGTASEDEAALPTVGQVKTYVTAEVADLEGALHFRGIVTSTSEITDPEDGDVCIVDTTEYIYASGAWKELGNESLWVPNTRTVAGVDLADDITASELKTALDIDDIETAIGTEKTSTEAGTGIYGRIEALEETEANRDTFTEITADEVIAAFHPVATP